MSADDLEKYEADLELALYREYRDVLPMFRFVVETDKRFYLANEVDVAERTQGPDTYFEIKLGDAWVWDMYRPARFVSSVRILTFSDVNVEELKAQTPDSPLDQFKGQVPDSPEGLS